MSQSTARTGPSGLIRPHTTPTPQPAIAGWDGDLEAAFHQIRQIAARPTPGPVPETIRFSIETAKVLADKAPELYEMSTGAAARFRLIANFLSTALDEAAETQKNAAPR